MKLYLYLFIFSCAYLYSSPYNYDHSKNLLDSKSQNILSYAYNDHHKPIAHTSRKAYIPYQNQAPSVPFQLPIDQTCNYDVPCNIYQHATKTGTLNSNIFKLTTPQLKLPLGLD